MEFYLKGTGIKLPYLTIDDYLGKTFQKEQSIQVHKEGFFIGKTNSYGFLGDVKKQKGDGVFRIGIIGDSFSEGFQMKPEFHFTGILEKELNSLQNEVEIEVLNFGISSVLFPQMYLRKRLLADQFDIDLFVYVLDNRHFIYPSEGVLERVVLEENDNELEVKYIESQSYMLYEKTKLIVDNSSLVNFLFEGYVTLRRKGLSSLCSDKFYQPTDDKFELSELDPFFQDLSSMNKLILKDIELQKPVFVIKESIHPMLAELLADYDISIIETRVPLDLVRQSGVDPNYWPLTQMYGHWNYKANQEIGVFLSKELIPYTFKAK